MLDLVARVAAITFAGAVVAQSPLHDALRSAAPLDLDGDGRGELRRVEPIAEVGDATKPLVLIVVEDRLWHAATALPDATPATALQERVHRLAGDMAAEGHRVAVAAVAVHRGAPHQDGRTLLGLRRLLQRVHAVAPLSAAVLLGHFPDALLVRTCNWHRHDVLTLPGKDGKPIAFEQPTLNVCSVPEMVAFRCDVVLADLDGEWERRYVAGPASLLSARAVFGEAVPEHGGECRALWTADTTVTDVFHVRDGAAVADVERFSLWLDANDRDHEVAAGDRAFANPLAQPEIAVSRIDARGVALSVNGAAIANGPDGKPSPIALPAGARPLSPSLATELQLLVSYLDRNHAYRTQPAAAEQFRPAAIGHGLDSGFGSLRPAATSWAASGETGYDVPQNADLVELARWLQRPAVLRTLRAHSDPWCAAFHATDPAALQRELGTPWHWVADGDRLVPSWRDHHTGRADFAFWQAQHARGGGGGPFLLLHTGCEVMAPPRAAELPFDHPDYGLRGHAEAILFFSECVAMIGRAKVFYDEPREFAATLGAGGTIGDAWRRYFAIEARAANWDEVGGDIGRKRAYFWSLVGDCTLRLRRVAP